MHNYVSNGTNRRNLDKQRFLTLCRCYNMVCDQNKYERRKNPKPNPRITSFWTFFIRFSMSTKIWVRFTILTIFNFYIYVINNTCYSFAFGLWIINKFYLWNHTKKLDEQKSKTHHFYLNFNVTQHFRKKYLST